MDEVDISDLREKYEVQLEHGYDTFVVVDGLPPVTEDQKPKLIKFLLKKLNSVGRTREDLIYMPMGDDGKSLRYAQTRTLPSRKRALMRSFTALPLLNIRRPQRPPLLCGNSISSPSTGSSLCASTS